MYNVTISQVATISNHHLAEPETKWKVTLSEDGIECDSRYFDTEFEAIKAQRYWQGIIDSRN